MKNIFTPQKMRDLDKYLMNELGYPSNILMENAGTNCSRIIEEKFGKNKKVVVLCGSGNNGGDGFVIARKLSKENTVKVFWMGKEDKMSHDTNINFNLLLNLGLDITFLENEDKINQSNFDCDVLIDALIGNQGDENLRGLFPKVLNACRELSAKKVAIDNPTGLNPLTGDSSSFTLTFDLTIPIFAIKTGQLLNDGLEKCGEIITAELDVSIELPPSFLDCFFIEIEDYRNLKANIDNTNSKFQNGRALLISGSRSLPGAACLAANACVTAGAGLVTLATVSPHVQLLPEVMLGVMEESAGGSIANSSFLKIEDYAKKNDVVGVGPGLGSNPDTLAMIKQIIEKYQDKPMVIDADGLRLFKQHTKLEKNFILTPHIGEFSRITGIPRIEIVKRRLELAKIWAKKLNCILLLKGTSTIITDGIKTVINRTGNVGLAKGGSGDVLTGIILALLANGNSTFDAAVYGAFLHGQAANHFGSMYNKHNLTPSDLIRELKYVV